MASLVSLLPLVLAFVIFIIARSVFAEEYFMYYLLGSTFLFVVFRIIAQKVLDSQIEKRAFISRIVM